MDARDFQKMVKRITFEQFKTMAGDKTLSTHEKIGFPDNYRDENHTKFIFEDIKSKVLNFADNDRKYIADIGCGCDLLAMKMIQYCEQKEYSLYLFDSLEM